MRDGNALHFRKDAHVPHTAPVLASPVPALATGSAPHPAVLARLRLAEQELARRQAADVPPPPPRASDDWRDPILVLRRAAIRGSAKAASKLGFVFFRGDGVSPDPDRAARWLRIAAARGDAPASGLLGVLTIEGRTPGVERDLAEGLRLLRLCAVAGSSKAQLHLGLLLLTTEDADDAAEAAHWLGAAADCEPEAAGALEQLRTDAHGVDEQEGA